MPLQLKQRLYRRYMSDIHVKIQNIISENPVVLFMKGSPEFPQCGFSSMVSRILDHLDISYIGVNVLEDQEIRQGIKDFTNWPTIPQLYLKGEFIGGCDIIKEMFDTKELQTLFQAQIST